MASWKPSNQLEQLIVDKNPGFFIFGNLTDYELKRVNDEELQNALGMYRAEINGNIAPTGRSLKIIRTVHEMAGTKNMGAEATLEDWDSFDNVEREITGMIRACGMGPSNDLPLHESDEETPYIIKQKRNHGNTFPNIFDDSFFDIETTRMRHARLIADFDENPPSGSKCPTNFKKSSFLLDNKKENTMNEIDMKEFRLRYANTLYKNDFHNSSPNILENETKTTLKTEKRKLNKSTDESTKFKSSKRLYTPKEVYLLKRATSKRTSKEQ